MRGNRVRACQRRNPSLVLRQEIEDRVTPWPSRFVIAHLPDLRRRKSSKQEARKKLLQSKIEVRRSEFDRASSNCYLLARDFCPRSRIGGKFSPYFQINHGNPKARVRRGMKIRGWRNSLKSHPR